MGKVSTTTCLESLEEQLKIETALRKLILANKREKARTLNRLHKFLGDLNDTGVEISYIRLYAVGVCEYLGWRKKRERLKDRTDDWDDGRR